MTASLDAGAIRAQIDRVEDPEVPVTLTDLGVVRRVAVDGDSVSVTLRPTRLACPGREEMARRVRAAVQTAAPGANVTVTWEMSPWQAGDVSPAGGRALARAGFGDPTASRPLCPYCQSARVRREGGFGGSVCKTPYTCRACGSSFDLLKNTPAERTGQ